MTTAARPTFNPAKGSAGARDGAAPTHQTSARDLTAHTHLKTRQPGQHTLDEVAKVDLKAELMRREKGLSSDQKALNDFRSEDDEDESTSPAVDKVESTFSRNIDADDSDDSASNAGANSDSSEESDDEDETALLLKELERIKQERSAEKERLERQRQEEEEQRRTEAIMHNNPLLNKPEGGAFTVKRRWDEDIVFKNQAKGVDDKPKKRFINDTLRSDFHKKFMDRYVK